MVLNIIFYVIHGALHGVIVFINSFIFYNLQNILPNEKGMSGYMNIARGSNMCSVASYNYYPTVSFNSSTTVKTASTKTTTLARSVITTRA